mmetsp:Transcript_58463/g.161779  ORF Transcript_58463/g.161779 Transcript_58463/m.161779 type:complete len:277 (-) Transcript_58463:42-872(-)
MQPHSCPLAEVLAGHVPVRCHDVLTAAKLLPRRLAIGQAHVLVIAPRGERLVHAGIEEHVPGVLALLECHDVILLVICGLLDQLPSYATLAMVLDKQVPPIQIVSQDLHLQGLLSNFRIIPDARQRLLNGVTLVASALRKNYPLPLALLAVLEARHQRPAAAIPAQACLAVLPGLGANRVAPVRAAALGVTAWLLSLIFCLHDNCCCIRWHMSSLRLATTKSCQRGCGHEHQQHTCASRAKENSRNWASCLIWQMLIVALLHVVTTWQQNGTIRNC